MAWGWRRGGGGYGGWRPYVPVARRRAQAIVAMEKLRKIGGSVQPVRIEGRKIAHTFWGQAWCGHLEKFSDYENRLPRGRAYVRNGSVCHLDIQKGRIAAKVSGSRMYDVDIAIRTLPKEKWSGVRALCAGQVGSMLELLQGRLSTAVMSIVTDRNKGLFPLPREISLDCSCPDWADMCKHVAAVLYGAGARLDEKPELLFLLRGVDHQELVSEESARAVVAKAMPKKSRTLDEGSLSEVFGIDLAGAKTAVQTRSSVKKHGRKEAHRSSRARLVALTACLFVAARADAAIRTETIAYRHGKTTLEGTISFDPAATGPRPAILVVHEWKGHGPYVVRRAEQLASLGTIAFAIDMYGKGVRASTHEEAATLSGVYRKDRLLMRSRAKAALDRLLEDPRVDPKRIAAIGYCFGGTTVLEMARAGMDLAAVASFHGGLDTPVPAAPGVIQAKVLVLHGADDRHANAGVAAFLDEMRRSGADWQMVSYGGAVHSFTVPEAGNDPSTGMAYDLKADRRSWQALRDFLDEALK